MNDDKEIFVQHIFCYGCDDFEKARRMQAIGEAGFVELKSRRGRNHKRWVIWYLPGPFSAKGPITGKQTKEIVSWLMKNIRPGEITVGSEHWGAYFD